MKLRHILATTSLFGTLALAGAASAQEIEIRFGTVNDPGGVQYEIRCRMGQAHQRGRGRLRSRLISTARANSATTGDAAEGQARHPGSRSAVLDHVDHPGRIRRVRNALHHQGPGARRLRRERNRDAGTGAEAGGAGLQAARASGKTAFATSPTMSARSTSPRT